MTGYADDGLSAEINYGAPILDDWPEANRYTITICYQRRAMTIPFYTAPAWGREPDVDDVMDCLRSDAVGVINVECFEEWADEFGLDDDSRRAETTYREVQRQTDELRQLLGDDFERIVMSNRRPGDDYK